MKSIFLKMLVEEMLEILNNVEANRTPHLVEPVSKTVDALTALKSAITAGPKEETPA